MTYVAVGVGATTPHWIEERERERGVKDLEERERG